MRISMKIIPRRYQILTCKSQFQCTSLSCLKISSKTCKTRVNKSINLRKKQLKPSKWMKGIIKIIYILWKRLGKSKQIAIVEHYLHKRDNNQFSKKLWRTQSKSIWIVSLISDMYIRILIVKLNPENMKYYYRIVIFALL